MTVVTPAEVIRWCENELGYSSISGIVELRLASDSKTQSSFAPIACHLNDSDLTKEQIEVLCRHKWGDIMKQMLRRIKSKGHIQEIRQKLAIFEKYGKMVSPNEFKEFSSNFPSFGEHKNQRRIQLQKLERAISQKREILKDKMTMASRTMEQIETLETKLSQLKSANTQQIDKICMQRLLYDETMIKIAMIVELTKVIKSLVQKGKPNNPRIGRASEYYDKIKNSCELLSQLCLERIQKRGVNTKSTESEISKLLEEIWNGSNSSGIVKDLVNLITRETKALVDRVESINFKEDADQIRANLKNIHGSAPLRIEEIVKNLRSRHVESFYSSEKFQALLSKELQAKDLKVSDPSFIKAQIEVLDSLLSEQRERNILLIEQKFSAEGKLDQIRTFNELLQRKQIEIKSLILQSQSMEDMITSKDEETQLLVSSKVNKLVSLLLDNFPKLKDIWTLELQEFRGCNLDYFHQTSIPNFLGYSRRELLPSRLILDKSFIDCLKGLNTGIVTRYSEMGLLMLFRILASNYKLKDLVVEDEDQVSEIRAYERGKVSQINMGLRLEQGSVSWDSLSLEVIKNIASQEQFLMENHLPELLNCLKDSDSIVKLYEEFNNIFLEREYVFNGNLDKTCQVKGKRLSEFIDAWHYAQAKRNVSNNNNREE